MNNDDDYDENDTQMVIVKWYYVPKAANWLAKTETMERVNPKIMCITIFSTKPKPKRY